MLIKRGFLCYGKNYLFTNFLLNFRLILAKEVDLVFGPKFFFSLNLNCMNCKYICKEFYFLSNEKKVIYLAIQVFSLKIIRTVIVCCWIHKTNLKQ